MGEHNRLLGYFDLLGFRKLVLTQPLEAVVARFTRVYRSIGSAAYRFNASATGFVDLEHESTTSSKETGPQQYDPLKQDDLPGIKDAFERMTGFSLLVMSDSVVFYSEPLTIESPTFPKRLSAAIRVSRILSMRLFEQLLPSRGALSFGEFFADPRTSIYCGKALVEAFEVAESQDWIGAVVSPSLEPSVAELCANYRIDQFLQDHTTARPDWDFLRWEVPFKTGLKPSFAINWGSAWNLGFPVRDDFFGDCLTGREEIDIKYHNTLTFLKEWNRLSLSPGLPER